MVKNTKNLKKSQSRGIYLLPNLFTTAALFSGFYSVVAAMKGLFDIAAIAIFVAMILDALDGRVARLTNTQSDFGAEYDSISDMVAFGVAPSLIIYSWSLFALGKMGWLAAFIFTAGTALRLARFNSAKHQDVDKRFFQGLPCPAAAGLIAGIVWFGNLYQLDGYPIAVAAGVVTVITASLMVSPIRYYSFKQVDFKGRVPYFSALITVLVFVAIAIDPPEVIFFILLLYTLSGPFITLYKIIKVKKRQLR